MTSFAVICINVDIGHELVQYTTYCVNHSIINGSIYKMHRTLGKGNKITKHDDKLAILIGPIRKGGRDSSVYKTVLYLWRRKQNNQA